MTRPVCEESLGECCEGYPWQILADFAVDDKPCRHVVNGVCPLVVYALNEGRNNSTAVCLACIKEASNRIGFA